MPEICEVILTAQFLSKYIGDEITKIKILRGRYTKKDIKGYDVIEFPLKIISIKTKGKFMWFELSHNEKKYYLLNTFGLTGKWFDEKLDFCNVKFHLKSDNDLYFDDVRNFGTLEFTNDVKNLNKKLDRLGDDLLQNPPNFEELKQRLEKINKTKKIAVVMMEQNKKNGIGSGLGNYLVPEILYRSGISPNRHIIDLSKKDIENLLHSMKYILKLCYITNTTDYVSHLSTFLKTHRNKVKSGKFPNYISDVKIENETFDFKVYRKKMDEFGNKIIGEEIIKGRTTYWCPNVQK